MSVPGIEPGGGRDDPPARPPLADSNVVVIGGTEGIGLATVRRLLAQGARVWCGSRTARAKTHLDVLGDRCTRVDVDVTDVGSVRALIEGIDRVDHLILTAAAVPSGVIATSDLDLLRPAMESRLFGALAAVQAVRDRMPASGSIVLFSGMAAHRGFPGEALAAASCGAVEAVVKTLAVELAPVRVNAVRPGNVWTATFRGFFGDGAEAARDTLAARLPLGRLSEPDEIAHAVQFLLENTSATGSVLAVDGGFAAV